MLVFSAPPSVLCVQFHIDFREFHSFGPARRVAGAYVYPTQRQVLAGRNDNLAVRPQCLVRIGRSLADPHVAVYVATDGDAAGTRGDGSFSGLSSGARALHVGGHAWRKAKPGDRGFIGARVEEAGVQ